MKDKFTQAATILKRAGRSAYVLESSDSLRTNSKSKVHQAIRFELSDIDDAYQAISVYMGDPIAKQHDSAVPADQMPRIRHPEQKLQTARPMRNRQPPGRLIYTKW